MQNLVSKGDTGFISTSCMEHSSDMVALCSSGECEAPTKERESQLCDVCGHWRLSTRAIGEGGWACQDCLSDQEIADNTEIVEGTVVLTYDILNIKTGKTSPSKITLYVEPGENARNFALQTLLEKLNAWNTIPTSYGKFLFTTSEKMRDWVVEEYDYIDDEDDDEEDEEDEQAGATSHDESENAPDTKGASQAEIETLDRGGD